jgi:hypothetical protein
MNAKQLAEKIGTKTTLHIEKLQIQVTILDGRQTFGRTEYLVSPLSGTGEQWVTTDRLTWGK